MTSSDEEGKYISLSKEIDELKSSSNSATEKAKAGAVLAGKSIFNLGKFLLKEGPPLLEKMNEDLKARIEENVARGNRVNILTAGLMLEQRQPAALRVL